MGKIYSLYVYNDVAQFNVPFRKFSTETERNLE